MTEFQKIEKIDDTISSEVAVSDPIVGAHHRPFLSLTDMDFELLLARIFTHRMVAEGWFDNVIWMICGADRGRDVWLTNAERPVGLVQCKRLKTAISAPAAAQEIIKFLLFAELDPKLLPDENGFRYSLALATDPAGTTLDLFNSPSTWLKEKGDQFDGYIAKVISQYASFDDLKLNKVKKRIKRRFGLLKLSLIRPNHLDDMLDSLPKVAAQFFGVRLVVDLDNAAEMIKDAVDHGMQGAEKFLPNQGVAKFIDEKIDDELRSIGRSRFFVGIETYKLAATLGDRLLSGDLSTGTADKRARALAMAARWQGDKGEAEQVKQLLDKSEHLGPTNELELARALEVAQDDWKLGLKKLAPLDSEQKRTVALAIFRNAHTEGETIAWVQNAGFDFASFGALGKFILLTCLIGQKDWASAQLVSAQVTNDEIEELAVLDHLIGMSALTNAVSPDLAHLVTDGVPMFPNPATYPLLDTELGLENRRKARNHFERTSVFAQQVGASIAARMSHGLRVWLDLRDPKTAASAMSELVDLLGGNDLAVSLIPLGLSFGALDNLAGVERGLAQLTAREPNGSPDRAMARLTLSLQQSTNEEKAAYFRLHRDEMIEHISAGEIIDVEINLLVMTGQREEAQGLTYSPLSPVI